MQTNTKPVGTNFRVAAQGSSPRCHAQISEISPRPEWKKEVLDARPLKESFDLPSAPPNAIPMLKSLGCDLTERAASGELDPLIGRETQLEQMIQALSRRRKNNPLLIGDPGVGKTAVVEGLAQRIARGDVPDVLQDRRIFQLDIATLLSGTKNRGDFEERVRMVLDEALASRKQIILFIDEIHTIAGAGSSGNNGSSLDAASMLKPVLARGDVQCIGATTIQEYRTHIEKDSSLERRFQPITVDQASCDETLQIIEGLAQKYESHHKVRYSADALVACVKLADEFIPERFMPDKAIDVFDEVGAFVQLRHQASSRKASEPEAVRDIRKKILDVVAQKDLAVKAENYSVAAELKLQETGLKRQLRLTSDCLSAAAQAASECAGIDVESADVVVQADDVAQIVSRMIGMPVEKLSDDESTRLLNLEAVLHKRVIGQDQAINAVSQALRRARVGLKNPKRPIASFLFCGPTGVGKTELCKALSEAYFGNEASMIRLDMSELMERHAVSKFIGSPAGYIGYGDENQLTDRVRRKPYTLVLFDEVEKAHSDVLNLMLQIMEDGHLTDANGRKVSFKNALIVMTSNVAGTHLAQRFSPEFLNRLDEIIPFSQLSKDEVADVAELEFAKTVGRVKDIGASLTLSESFKSEVIDKGFDALNGARPMRRSVVKLLDDELANLMLMQPVIEGERVHVDFNNKQQIVIVREPAVSHENAFSDTESTKESENSGHSSAKEELEPTPLSAETPLSEIALSGFLSGPLHKFAFPQSHAPAQIKAER
jgi:ATP-dependent Clp protease ATP-binding subunit ClpC